MAVIAEAAGIDCYIGGALEGPIAARACLHFGASTSSVNLGCEMYGQFLLEEDLGSKPLRFKDGCLLVPTGPGLGGELNPDKVKKFEVGRLTIDHS